jgi:hypothetical protein
MLSSEASPAGFRVITGAISLDTLSLCVLA